MSLSMVDKTIRLSLMTYPRTLGVGQYYPALSTYRVERPFSIAQIKRAVSAFLDGNPFFPACHVTERRFESPEAFPVSSFQGVVIDEYASYHASFLVMSVTYESDPRLQGIFTVFPLSLQDGYMCFRFHQALMKTLKSGEDQFRIAETIAELGLQTGDLDRYLPVRQSEMNADEAHRSVPFQIEEFVEPARKVGPYLETVKTEFLERSCENLVVIKNASYASDLLFGNHLMFLRVPRDVVARGTGIEIRDYYNAQQAELGRLLGSLETPEDFAGVGASLMPGMLTHPRRFFVNNYGDVSRHDGSDLAPTSGVLVKYQWHMPNVVLGLMTGQSSGADWTISIDGTAFRCRSARQESGDSAFSTAAELPDRAVPVS